MQAIDPTVVLGRPRVTASPPGGFTAEQWADLVTDRLVSIAETTAGPAREQALAFRAQLRASLVRAFSDALTQQRAGIAHALEAVGQREAALVARAFGG
jgi:regulator of protease activity HflC (stomatin/prohibitin superfamily)